jgi:superoxide reductase
MAKENQIYKCDDGAVVEILNGEPNCGQALSEKSEEEGFTEKHKPVVEEQDDGAFIKIGSVPHPMEEEHYIE